MGLNAYELATDFGTNAGCGSQETDAQLDQLFSSLPPDSLIRINASQGSMVTNVTPTSQTGGPSTGCFPLPFNSIKS